jgi:hypothetical protein
MQESEDKSALRNENIKFCVSINGSDGCVPARELLRKVPLEPVGAIYCASDQHLID